MKKLLAILLIFTTALLYACSVQRYSDVEMFCRLFNSEYGEKLLESKNVLITEEDGCRQYNFKVGDDTLIVLYTDTEKVRIKEVCITVIGKVEEITGKRFEKFLLLSSCATFAFSGKEDSFEEISKALGIPLADEYSTAVTQYAASKNMSYAYSADVTGVFFSIKNISLCSESESELTLREANR